MTNPNLQRFSEAFYALDRDDVSIMAALLRDDVRLETPERTVEGKAAAMAFFAANAGAFKSLAHVVDLDNGVIDAGDAIAVEFVVSGIFVGELDPNAGIRAPTDDEILAPTGQAFAFRATDHVWFDGEGKITCFKIFYDPGELFAQVRTARPILTAGKPA